MPQDVKIWEIQSNNILREIKKSKLEMEERIEKWLEKDISIISSDLLVIGRQVETDFGGVIDLLCLDHNGDVVIIELKRDKTPREVTAQVLDYTSWVKDLSNEKITEIANKYLGEKEPLEIAFKEKFGEVLPEIINEHHKMLIVASEVDSSTERIIEYLSNTYGVGINAVTFHYFQNDEGKEFLARVFLIEPQQVEYRTQTKSTSKRKPPLTYEELEEIAESNGVGELYKKLVGGLTPLFDQKGTTRSTIAFIGIVEGSRLTIFSIIPGDSNSQQGLRFQVYIDRLAKYLNIQTNEVMQILPPDCKEYEPWKGAPRTLAGYFKEKEEVDIFIKGLDRFKRKLDQQRLTAEMWLRYFAPSPKFASRSSYVSRTLSFSVI